MKSKIVIAMFAVMTAFVGQAESSTPFRLSLKSDGVRQSAGMETLTYSSLWDGGDGATVTIAQNGAMVADGLSGEGTRPWSVTRNGTYVLTHTTYTNGVAGKVETATFVVTGKDVAFAADDVTVTGFAGKYDGAAHGVGVTVKDGIEDVVVRYAAGDGAPALPWSETAPTITDVGAMTVWCEIAAPGYITQTNSATVVISPREVMLTSGSANKAFDGTPLINNNVTVGGDGFVDGEGASYNVTGSQTNVGESENVFTYTLNDGTKAGNYNITTANGKLTVTKANVGGGASGGEEPGNGEVPQGGVSKFDASFVYDGEGHTINTNALRTAFGNAMVGASVIEYAIDDGSVSGGVGHAALPWCATAPAYTNAGEYIAWYRVTNPNYEDFTHAAKLSIRKRDATLTSGSSSWIYDGIAHSNMAVTATGFVDGEGVTTNNFATIKNIGSVANAFDYAFIDGTLAGNYNVTCVTGTLSVVSAQMDEWTDEAKWTVTLSGNNQKYDGTEKTCEVTAIAYDGFSIPTYTVTGNKGTDAGDYTLTVTGSGNFSGSHTFNWSIAKRAVTLTSGSATKVYDASPLINQNVIVGGDGFVAGEGASYNVTGSQTNVGESENAFTYALSDGTKASNYNITTVNGTLTVAKANVGGGIDGGEEPGAGEVPQGGVSKFDASFVYDGEGHTIDTNTLTAAFGNAMVGASAIEYAVDDGSVSGGVGHAALPWDATAPAYTNAGEYIIWYRVTNPNYEDFVHAAKLSITKRDAILTSGSSSWIYDGIAHSNTAVTAIGFVDGEGVITNNFATIKNIGSVANAFDYAFIEGTLAGNYNVTCVTGTLSVVSAQMDEWTDEAKWAVTLSGNDAKYDGTEKTCEVTAIAYDGFSIPTYTVTGNKGTDAGEYTLIVAGTGNFSGSHTFKWSIVKREVTLTSASANKVYDGTALVNGNVTVGGDGFVDGEGAIFNVAGSRTNVGESENTFSYTLNDNTKASNYNITTVNGMLTVTKANVGGGAGGGEEPGDGEVPQGGVSKFDVSFVYDGEGHMIDTNALTVVFGNAMAGASVIEYVVDADAGGTLGTTCPTSGWISDVPVYTNAGEYVVWYRVTNPNYEDFVHAAKLSITKRDATLTSGSSSWIYDGVAHSNMAVMATGFVVGEGVTTNNFAIIENIGSVANAFDYAFIDGTLAGNYNVTCVTGTLSVVSAQMDEWTDEAKWTVTLSGNNQKYDGTEKTCEVTAIAYDGFSIPTYTVTGNKATDAGEYTLTVAGTGNFSGSHTFNWSIVKRAVTLTSGSANKVYDGTALVNGHVTVGGDGFVDGEGASYNVTGSQTNVGDSENAFTYTLNDSTKAGNYNITTVNGTLTVTKANVGGGAGGGEEPGAGEVPQGGVSKFDASFVYDGEGHTIDTNALTAAFGSAMVGSSVIEYAIDDGSVSGGVGHAALPWCATAPVYTNAGEYIIWYRVTNPNYNTFTHAAKVTITPRTGVVVDIVGNIATNMYSGAAQSVDGYTVAINDSLYKETDFEFTGNSVVSGTAAGKYPMGLLASQFSNKNENFADVTFNVTDGELVILGSLQKSVILDAIGGTFADGTVVTQECEDVYLAFPVATREGYAFDGWYLGVTNGAPKAMVGAELLVDDDHTLFAKWKIDETLMPGGESIFTWEAIDANTARITGFKNSEQKLTTLALPDTIDGKAVVEIADGAFANSRSGMTRILLSMYCVKIGYAAFTGVSTLTDIVFSDVRSWQTPDVGTTLSIGAYAFSGVGVSTVTLPATVSAIGDYAFANCAKLSNITILGQPAVGTKPLRRAGTGVGGVTVHLDPALASDNAYMEALKQECLNVTVRADAVVKRMKLSSLSMARNFIVLSVSVEKAAVWGKVDLSAIKVAYRKTLSDEPYMLAPSAIVENPDGSLSVEVPVPAGDSGFFQVVFQK